MFLHEVTGRHLVHLLYHVCDAERFDGAWNFVGDQFALSALARVSYRDWIEKSTCVGILRVADDAVSGANFYDLS